MVHDKRAAATNLDVTTAARDGKGADKLAQEALEAAGFTITATNRLERYVQGGQNHVPLPGFWTRDDVDRRGGYG